jgi:hypothetical protein
MTRLFFCKLVVAVILVPTCFGDTFAQAQSSTDEQLKAFDRQFGAVSCMAAEIPRAASDLMTRHGTWSVKVPLENLSNAARKEACDAAQHDRADAVGLKARAQAETSCPTDIARALDYINGVLDSTKRQITDYCPSGTPVR